MATPTFNSIEAMIDFLPDEEAAITEALRDLVFDCIPEVSEKLSYNVPFFSRNKQICYIWPGAVLWGDRRTYDGVRFGFIQGHLLTDETHILEKGDRKHVYWADFQRLEDVPFDDVRQLLYEAAMIDDGKL